jgi:hypothetical protein
MSKRGQRKRDLRETSIEGEIAQLCDLDLRGLRLRWQNMLDRSPPEHVTRYLLFRVLAYRLQADRHGDLDAETLKVLRQVGAQDDGRLNASMELAKLDQRRFVPPPGTVLVREWDRKPHRVMVMSDGFAWNGRTFDSLSKVAFAITGTKWNGPRFFGLRDRRPKINAGDAG